MLNYVGTRLSRRIMAAANLLKIAVLLGSGRHGRGSRATPATCQPDASGCSGAVDQSRYFGSDRRRDRERLLQLWRVVGGRQELLERSAIRERNLPLAFTCGVLLVTLVYLLVSFAFLSVVPLEQIVSNTAFVAQFGEALFGSVGGKVLSACVLAFGARWLDGTDHGIAARLLRDGERWRILPSFRTAASALRHTGQRGACCRPGLRSWCSALVHSIAFFPSSSSRQSVFLRPVCCFVVPAQGACDGAGGTPQLPCSFSLAAP